MSARVGVLTFPGSNSEVETLRALRAVGVTAELLHWSADLAAVRAYDAYLLPGGFSYEDRVRAGAIAARDRLMEAVREGAATGKLVLGICNGAQILLEAGLVAQAGFIRNASGGFLCRQTFVTAGPGGLAHCAITASLPPEAVIPMWAAHGEGRLAAHAEVLDEIEHSHRVVFVYADASGAPVAAPNGSALNAAALVNEAGNVLALMPHPERQAWLFQQPWGAERRAARGNRERIMEPAGGSLFFQAFAAALEQG
jgi:phosphoribosylformylglycinamidine synthase I